MSEIMTHQFNQHNKPRTATINESPVLLMRFCSCSLLELILPVGREHGSCLMPSTHMFAHHRGGQRQPTPGNTQRQRLNSSSHHTTVSHTHTHTHIPNTSCFV